MKCEAEKQIAITHNLVYNANNITYSIRAGRTPDDFADIYAFNSEDAMVGEPLFVSPAESNFYLQPDPPGCDVGAFPAGTEVDF